MSLVPAYEGNKPYIFVSYAHKDSDFVQPIIAELFEKKYRVWYDEGIAPGSEWPKNIADHLNGCKGAIVFVSESSINSKNCENEVARIVEKEHIRQFSVDGSKHRLLEKAIGEFGSAPNIGGDAAGDHINDRNEAGDHIQTVNSLEELIASLPSEYIGDGTGYNREISKKRAGGIWNILIAVAVVLAIAIGVGLYGLNQGWFDKYLPALAEAESVADESETLKAQEAEIKDANLAKLIAEATGRTDLTEKVKFTSESDWYDFCGSLGLDPKYQITIMDLQYLEQDLICFDNASDEMLSYLKHMPNVREIELNGERVTTLEELVSCPRLEIVWVRECVLPVTIPEATNFEVRIRQ